MRLVPISARGSSRDDADHERRTCHGRPLPCVAYSNVFSSQQNGGGGNRTPVRRRIHERIYVRSLRTVVAPLAPTGGISRRHPAFDLGPRPAGVTGTQPEVWRLSPPYGRRQVKRRGLIRQRVRSYCLQLSSPALFTR